MYCHPHVSSSLFCLAFSLVIFFWLLFKFFFIIGFEQFDCYVSWCTFLHVSCAWGCLSFLDLWVYNFHPLWENWGLIIHSTISSVPTPLGIPITSVLVHYLVFCFVLFFFSIFLSVCVSFWTVSVAISLNLPISSSSVPTMVLIPSNVFFIYKSLICVIFYLSCLYLIFEHREYSYYNCTLKFLSNI